MIGFAGLSHLGIVSSVAAASLGAEVVGYDGNVGIIRDLTAGRSPVLEPGLAEALAGAAGRLHFTHEPGDLQNCDIVFIALDMPTDDNGQSDLRSVQRLAWHVAEHARCSTVLVILSQVRPGFTRGLQQAIAATWPQKGFTVVYQCETLVFGQALERALGPERHIVGCSERLASLPLSYAEHLARWPCPVQIMSYETAELTKIAVNTCLASMICTTNMLADISERLGADWTDMVLALRRDRRIGQHAYLTPGLGLGGNLERDLVTLRGLAGECSARGDLVDAWLADSSYRARWTLRALQANLPHGLSAATIGLWGLAYKPGTSCVRRSPAIMLASDLAPSRVLAYDPVVVLDPKQFSHVSQVDSPFEACDGVDALVIATPWPEFAEIAPDSIERALRGSLVIDPYHLLPQLPARLTHVRLGERTLERSA